MPSRRALITRMLNNHVERATSRETGASGELTIKREAASLARLPEAPHIFTRRVVAQNRSRRVRASQSGAVSVIAHAVRKIISIGNHRSQYGRSSKMCREQNFPRRR